MFGKIITIDTNTEIDLAQRKVFLDESKVESIRFHRVHRMDTYVKNDKSFHLLIEKMYETFVFSSFIAQNPNSPPSSPQSPQIPNQPPQRRIFDDKVSEAITRYIRLLKIALM